MTDDYSSRAVPVPSSVMRVVIRMEGVTGPGSVWELEAREVEDVELSTEDASRHQFSMLPGRFWTPSQFPEFGERGQVDRAVSVRCVVPFGKSWTITKTEKGS